MLISSWTPCKIRGNFFFLPPDEITRGQKRSPRGGCTRPLASFPRSRCLFEGDGRKRSISFDLVSARGTGVAAALRAQPPPWSPAAGSCPRGCQGAALRPARSGSRGEDFVFLPPCAPHPLAEGTGDKSPGAGNAVPAPRSVSLRDGPQACRGRGGAATAALNLNKIGGEGKNSPSGDGAKNARVLPRGPHAPRAAWAARRGQGDRRMGTRSSGGTAARPGWGGHEQRRAPPAGPGWRWGGPNLFPGLGSPKAAVPKGTFPRLSPRDFPGVIFKCPFPLPALPLFFFF